MDIRLAITSASLFFFIYSLVLGIPFALGYKYGMWRAATWAMLVLATAGPFLYMALRSRAERRFLQEELKIQEFLMQSSYSMTSIHDLKKLMELVSFLIQSSLQVNHVQIYLLEPDTLQYRQRFPDTIEDAQNKTFSAREPVVELLKRSQATLVKEELRFDSNYGDSDSLRQRAVEQMNQWEANVIIPIITNANLLGFINLGERARKEIYSTRILAALSVLGNQSALAIENCNFWTAETRRMQEEGFQERIASLDMMASSFAHEIDNPMGIINGHVDFLSEILEQLNHQVPEDTRNMALESFQHIRDASQRVSGMIRAILDYSRMGTGELKPVRMESVVTDFLKLISPKIKSERVILHKDMAADLPFVLGDKIQLEEILMNFVTNAMHAVRDLKEKVVWLKVFLKDPQTVRLEVKDNGYGIKPQMLEDIFLASVTTKGSREGTGLGLYRARKIADIHHGQVWAESEGPGQGASLILELPVYTGDIQDTMQSTATTKKVNKKVF